MLGKWKRLEGSVPERWFSERSKKVSLFNLAMKLGIGPDIPVFLIVRDLRLVSLVMDRGIEPVRFGNWYRSRLSK